MFHIASTYSMTAALRQSIIRLQSELARGQKEFASGRHADLGVALGARMSVSFSLAGTREAIDSARSTNGLVATRLETTQVVLSSLLSDARRVRDTLIAAQTGGGDRHSIVAQMRDALATLIAKLNSGDGDGFLFSGVNVDREPIVNYFSDPPAANKIAVDAAFFSAFGVEQTDPAVSGITEMEILDFLSGPFQALFAPSNWKASWSSASDAPLLSRIGPSRTIESSITANAPALRELAAAYTMVSDLGAIDMNHQSYAIVIEKASQTLTNAIALLTKVQAGVGMMQRSVQTANETMAMQSDTILTQLRGLEAVDPTDAATRINGLMTQIEAAYALTSRISQLSLTRYL